MAMDGKNIIQSDRNILKALEGRNSSSPVRERWDPVDKMIEALKGRNIIRAPHSNNISPFQGSMIFAIPTQRFRTGLEEFRPFRAFKIDS